MRKFLLSLTMLMAGAMAVWAQEPVLSLDMSTINSYPYKLSEEDANKVYELSDLTIAVQIDAPANISGRMALFATSDPTKEANTSAEGTNSRYVAYGMNGADAGYLASWKSGDRFTGGAGITANATNMVVVYVVNPTNNKFQTYINGNKVGNASFENRHVDGFMQGYEIATPKMVKADHTDAKIYIGGGEHKNGYGEVFNGTIKNVRVYNGALTAEDIAAIKPILDITEELNALDAAIEEATALFNKIGDYIGEGVGKYSTTISDYATKFDEVKEFRNAVGTTNPTPEEVNAKTTEVEALIASFELNMPEEGKFYRIKAVKEWNDDAPYLGSKNSTAKGGRAEFVADADVYTIFHFDGAQLKNYATGEYLVNNSSFIGYSNGAISGASFSFHEASNKLVGAYNISFNDGGRWLYVNTANYTDAGSSTNTANGYCFNLEEVTELPVAKIGDTPYYSLAEAVGAAQAGETVTLLADVNVNETITIPAGKTITLDLNGKTITGTPAAAEAYAVITNRGTLTITGEGSVICNHTLAGSTSYAVNTITNCGTLTINGPTIKNVSTATNQIGYAIDNNSTSTDAIVTVENGEVIASGSYYYDGIRQFCNSTTAKNDVIVKGGEVSTIWMQNPSDGADKNTKEVKGSVTIEGGSVGVLSLEPSTSFEAAMTGGHVGEISYFQEAAGRNLVQFVSGGTLDKQISEELLVWGYQLTGDAAPFKAEYTGNRNEATFVDGEFTKYTNESDINVGTITYTRNLTAYWNPIYLPFDVELSTEHYDVAEFTSAEGTTLTLTKIGGETATLKANTAYVIRPKSEEAKEAKKLTITLTDATLKATTVTPQELGEGFSVRGNYSVLAGSELGDNDRVVNGKTGNWGVLKSESTLKPFRLILSVPEDFTPEQSAAISMRVLDNTTGVEETIMDGQEAIVIYDLMGRRVETMTEGGIYIVNGKKVIR